MAQRLCLSVDPQTEGRVTDSAPHPRSRLQRLWLCEAIRLRGQVENETGTVQFEVVDKPGVPSAPSKPNRPLLLAMVLLAGLGAGAGTAFALGHLQTSFPTAAKLEKASGLPVIGSISQMLTSAQREERKRKLRQFAGGSAALLGAFFVLLVIEFIQRGMAA